MVVAKEIHASSLQWGTHRGHLDLVDRATELSNIVIIGIFVISTVRAA